MRKLMLLAMLAVGALIVGTTSEAKADHRSGCGSGFGDGGFYSGYSFVPSYYAPVYTYSYGPVNSFGYAYPSSGFSYSRPGLSISIGSGYRNNSFGGYRGYGSGHHHHHHHH
jgi:hypothetical protein